MPRFYSGHFLFSQMIKYFRLKIEGPPFFELYFLREGSLQINFKITAKKKSGRSEFRKSSIFNLQSSIPASPVGRYKSFISEHARILHQNQQKACGAAVANKRMSNIDGMLLDP